MPNNDKLISFHLPFEPAGLFTILSASIHD